MSGCDRGRVRGTDTHLTVGTSLPELGSSNEDLLSAATWLLDVKRLARAAT